MSRKGIVLAGTVILDIVHLIDRWPEEDQVAMIARSEYGAGGPPHNAAAGLARLKAPFPVTLLGVVGDDAYGDIFVEQARGYGLDPSGLIRRKGAATSNTHVMTSIATGRRTFFHQTGVNATLSVAELLPPLACNGQIYYIGAPGIARALDGGDGWRIILKDAKARGFRTALELVPVSGDSNSRLVPPLLPLVDICVINDSEAEAVTGLAVTRDGMFDWSAAASACRRLLELGVGEVAVIHHPDGAVAVEKTGKTAEASAVNVRRDEIVGSVGAGDAFYAGMLLGLHEDWPLADCLALANASAATSLHSATTSASIRSWQDCLAYAKERGLKARA